MMNRLVIAEKTYNFHKTVLTCFTEEMGKYTLCKQVAFSDIKKFINKTCTTVSSKTAYLTPFRNLYKYLQKELDFDYSPNFESFGSRTEKRKEKSKIPVILSEDDLWKLVEVSLEEYKDKDQQHIHEIYAWVVYFYVGMRTAQLAWTKVRDVDIENQRIHIGRNKSTKSYKPRKSWLPPQAHKTMEFLMEGKQMHDYLYSHDNNDSDGRFMRSASYKFQKMYKKVFPRRDHMVMYNLRHSCGCWLLEKGFTLMFVREQLGHSELEQVLTYARMTGKTQNNEISRYNEKYTNNGVVRFEQILSKLKG